MHRLLIALLLLAAGPVALRAQSASDTLLAGAVPIASFEDARSVALDPFGRLYVADAGRHVVVALTPDGLLLGTLGGPGSGEGEFDEPSDVDPTNGLLILVADAGNGRIQRFSKEWAFLGTLSVGRPDRSASNARSTYRRNEAPPSSGHRGRPVSVRSASANETFAVDADARVVLRWNERREALPPIGGYGAGEGSLVDPVALALDGQGSVFVADRGLGSVVVFDTFGTYVRTMASGRVPDVVGLAWHAGRLWIVCPDRLLTYEGSGRFERAMRFELEDELVDVAFGDRDAFVLTASRLYRVPLNLR